MEIILILMRNLSTNYSYFFPFALSVLRGFMLSGMYRRVKYNTVSFDTFLRTKTLRTSGKNVLFMGFLLIAYVSAPLGAAQKPYIPSYDDRYQDDLKQANTNKNYFKEPNDALNYAQYHYIGAHGAEKYPRFFSEYRLQEQPLPGILSTGVRGLMLSVYDWPLNWSSFIREGMSIMCARLTQDTMAYTKNGRKLYQTLHYEMNRIFNFLKAHPQAIITILFDDQCAITKLMRDMKEVITKNSYNPILKPSDWRVAQEKGEWPTLGWMRSNNKRLVLFTQTCRNHTDFTWPVENYFWENNYGTTDTNVACTEEKESLLAPNKKNRKLVSFGCFGVPGTGSERNYRRCFDYDFVKKLTTTCKKRKFAQGRTFNAYWADHIIDATNDLVKNKKKTVFDYVNELNTVTSK